MIIRRTLALAAMILAAHSIAGDAAKDTRCYELRIYHANEGKLDALNARFRDHTVKLFEKHGITNVGYWIPVQSDSELGIDASDTFIYIRGYPSKAERDKRLKAAHDDPEFAEVVTKQERDPNTKLIIKAHNIDMVPSGSYTAIKIAP